MGQDEAPQPATKRRKTWAWVLAGLIGFVAAIVLIVTLVTRRSDAPHRARRTHGSSGTYFPSPADLDSASNDVQRAVADRVVPGAALAIGERTRTVELAGYGRVGWSPKDDSVSADSTMYDLASLTKAVA